MKKQITKLTSIIPSLTIGTFLFAMAACSPSETPEVDTTAQSDPLQQIEVIESKPTEFLSVQKARAELKPGDTALVHGQIGGVDQPFMDGYAGFVLGDTDILFCDEMPEDQCPKPWDACCEDVETLKVSRASVQFVDADGNPIETNLKGFNGLKELSEVIVSGTVAQSSTPDNLIINARAIYKD